MPTMHEHILTTIETATASILTGGIFGSDDIDIASGGGISWARDVGLVSGSILTPHGILRWKDSTAYQTEAGHLQAELQTAELYMYAHYGQYSLLESAIKPIRVALPYGVVYQADDRPLYDVKQIDAFGEMPAEEYQMRPSRMLRLQIVHVR